MLSPILRVLFLGLLYMTSVYPKNEAARISNEELDRLAEDALEALKSKLDAIREDELSERLERAPHRTARSATSSGCPFASRQRRSFDSLGEQERNTKVAAVYEETTRELLATLGRDARTSADALELINRRLQKREANSARGTCPVPVPTSCDPSKPYREFDGSCNNLDHPQWGQAYSCERRLLPAAYYDGVSEPRVGRSGRPLPSTRLISYKVHPEKDVPDRKLSHLTMAFGQFLDHDIAFVPTNTLPPLETYLGAQNGFSNGTMSLNIEVPSNDPFYSQFKNTSLFFLRSLPCCHCHLGPRQQSDSRTPFIDASQIYGIKKAITDSLRTFSGGQLKVQEVNGSLLLPPSPYPDNDTCSDPENDLICFRAGDFRVNQNAGLVSLHTVGLREHNRIACKLAQVNPHWNDELLFQVTRKIVGARLQHVVFDEWLPWIVGPKAMREHGLSPRKNGYTEYNARLDPTMINEFAAAAFRFGHSDVYGTFDLIGPSGKRNGAILLKDNYFRPFDFYDPSVEDAALRGFMKQAMQTTDRYGDTAVTNYLFRPPGSPSGNDLFAVDMQRGRDHGIRPYVDYVRLCKNITIRSFDDLHRRKLMPKNIAKLYSEIYEDVRDIDLFSAGLNENLVSGAALGPTFLCIVADMMSRLKGGDRFYYEHGGQAGSFSKGQLRTIRQTTMAKIICENTGIKSRIPRDVFDLRSPRRVDCKDLPDIDVKQWADRLMG